MLRLLVRLSRMERSLQRLQIRLLLLLGIKMGVRILVRMR
ncbi:hypothetical protein BBU64B_F0032 (plasmid) [Borreliella burgdorferi 64b]|nr:hypothetical protein BBU64B_F0032 [Borreliella burgdorferi 64b]